MSVFPQSTDGKVRCLMLSYGKDSIACLEAIKQLGWPLDMIVHTEVWSTKTIPADLPPMMEFKGKADQMIMERYGMEVHHVCATRKVKNKDVHDGSTPPTANSKSTVTKTDCMKSSSVGSTSEKSEDSQQSQQAEDGARISRKDCAMCTDTYSNISNRMSPPPLITAQNAVSYEDLFYKDVIARSPNFKGIKTIKGFPLVRNQQWCKKLKSEYVNMEELVNTVLPPPENDIWSYEDRFYKEPLDVNKEKHEIKHDITGFAMSTPGNNWCKELKKPKIKDKREIIKYLGIAADEPERIAKHSKPDEMLPLVEIGWDESYCRKWCEENDLLSPIYSDTIKRGGCWFCHNQGIESLRQLRHNYPELWHILLKWDNDSPVTFKPNGITVHHFDKRFEMEDKELVPKDRTFRWKMLDEKDPYESVQITAFDYLKDENMKKENGKE